MNVRNMSSSANHFIQTRIQLRITNFTEYLTLLLVFEVVSCVPMEPMNRGTLKIPRNVQLADSECHKLTAVGELYTPRADIVAATVRGLDSTNQARYHLTKDLVRLDSRRRIASANTSYNRNLSHDVKRFPILIE